MTDAVVTQQSVEQWSAGNPDARATSISIEQWAVVALGNPQVVLTTIAIEQWAPNVSAAQLPRVMILA